MQAEDGHVMIETEIAVMPLPAKEHQGLPASTRSWKQGSPLQVSEEGLTNFLISNF